MRIISTLKNSAYAIMSYMVLAVLGILVRKAFLESLSIELLGYEGLLGNIFSILSLSDLGIETLIMYRLFSAVAKNNTDDINTIMSVYKLLYRFVGIVIFILSLLLIPFLKYLVKDNNLEWNYVYFIYFIQLINTLCTYFLAYKRLIFSVNQQEYICIRVDTVVSLVFNLIKIGVLLLLKSYVLYLICNFATSVIANLIISKKADNEFEYIDNNRVAHIDDVTQLHIGTDVKNNIVQKISVTIYGGTDNIIISAFVGIAQTGLFANYTLIQGYVTKFFVNILRPFQMAIGNHIYATDYDTGENLFKMFDFVSYMLACMICISYANLFNPTIALLFGQKYLLGFSFVLAITANQYIMWNHQFLCFYRNAFGRYDLDKHLFLLGAIANVVLSILLCKPYGITGVMIGTAIGHFGIWIGRVRVVYSEYIREPIYRYIKRQLIRVCTFVLQLVLSIQVCNHICSGVIGLILRIVFCICFSVAFTAIVYFRTQEMRDIGIYIKKTLNMVFN